MIRLVVNADDLGLHPRIDDGIFEAREGGIVTSATLLSAGRTAEAAVRRAQSLGMGVGVHLCLSTGLPPCASDVATVAPGGVFRRSWAQFARDFLFGRVRISEVERELSAQVARARALGAKVDHLDAHQHLHALPLIATVVRRLAERERLPLRWPLPSLRLAWLSSPGAAVKAGILGALSLSPQLLWAPKRVRAHGIFEAGRLDERTLLALLRALPSSGRHELGCHPGHHPGAVPEDPQWRYGWDAERVALQSPRVRAEVDRLGITLCRYGELF